MSLAQSLRKGEKMSRHRIPALLRTYADRPSIVVVREIRGDVPIVCRPELADAIESGTLDVTPIGARREDLYELSDEVAALVKAGEPINWDQLRHAQLD